MNTLIITGYNEQNRIRMMEYVECLKINSQNKFFNKITIFLEHDINQFKNTNHQIVLTKKRPTYQDIFNYANGFKGDIIVVSNSDMYFDESINLLSSRDITGQFLAISRVGLPDNFIGCTQDCWIFKSPIPKFDCDFYFGIPGCDNKIALLSQNAGLKVKNPCLDIKVYHMHKSEKRNYTSQQSIPGPYLFVNACHL